MAQHQIRPKAEGEEEALLYVLQVAAGVLAWLLIASIVENRVIGDALGFFGFCAAAFPFARRTWAADLPASQYWTGAVIGTAVGAALRLIVS